MKFFSMKTASWIFIRQYQSGIVLWNSTIWYVLDTFIRVTQIITILLYSFPVCSTLSRLSIYLRYRLAFFRLIWSSAESNVDSHKGSLPRGFQAGAFFKSNPFASVLDSNRFQNDLIIIFKLRGRSWRGIGVLYGFTGHFPLMLSPVLQLFRRPVSPTLSRLYTTYRVVSSFFRSGFIGSWPGSYELREFRTFAVIISDDVFSMFLLTLTPVLLKTSK